jgi:hypothetical protein
MFRKFLVAGLAAAAAAFFSALPAQALSTKECGALYQTAKEADKLKGATWNEFRKANCGAEAASEEPAKAEKPAKKKKTDAAATEDPAKPDKKAKAKKTDAAAAEEPATADKKPKAKKVAAVADEPAEGKLTAKECSAKYQDAKANDVLNGMKWNDFRKAMCGSDAAAAPEPAEKPKKAKKVVLAEAGDTSGAAKLSAKECSSLYQDAKEADALDGMKWNDFRKAKCGSDAAAAPEPVEKPKKAKAVAAAAVGRLSAKDCSAKYQAAKEADTLNGMKWNDYRKSECTSDSQEAPDDVDVSADNDPVEPALVSTAKAPKGVKFPRSVSADYSDLSEGRARMRTCVDAYHINKDNGSLNGLKWIQKGGGFYSLCNAKLKGL